MLILSIDVTKIDKSRLIPGKKQRTDGSVGKYLELIVTERRDGGDQYGNTHMVAQGVTKDERAQGVRGDILGSGKEFVRIQQERRAPQRPPAQSKPPVDPDLDVENDEIPF